MNCESGLPAVEHSAPPRKDIVDGVSARQSDMRRRKEAINNPPCYLYCTRYRRLSEAFAVGKAAGNRERVYVISREWEKKRGSVK